MDPQINPLGAALAVLFLNFPGGLTDGMKTTYLSELQRLGIEPGVLAEAAQRILHTREQRTVPPFAVILKACREVQHERCSQDEEGEKVYTLEEARDLARRRLEYMNRAPNVWRKVPVNDANIDAHVKQMAATGFRVERE